MFHLLKKLLHTCQFLETRRGAFYVVEISFFCQYFSNGFELTNLLLSDFCARMLMSWNICTCATRNYSLVNAIYNIF